MAKRGTWIQSLVGPFSAVPSNKANALPSLALPDPFPAWHSSITWSVIWHCSHIGSDNPHHVLSTLPTTFEAPWKQSFIFFSSMMYLAQSKHRTSTEGVNEMPAPLPSYSCSTRENFLPGGWILPAHQTKSEFRGQCHHFNENSSPVLDSLPQKTLTVKSQYFIYQPNPQTWM